MPQEMGGVAGYILYEWYPFGPRDRIILAEGAGCHLLDLFKI